MTNLQSSPFNSDRQRDNLDVVTRFIGWGEPHATLWFIALEENATFDEEYLDRLRSFDRGCHETARPGNLYWQSAAGTDAPFPDRRSVEAYEKKIIEQLAGNRLASTAWHTLRFHCNLYALGYNRSRQAFPPAYHALFGIGGPADPAYRDALARRHRALGQMQAAYRPAATVCLGLTCADEFRRALSLDEAPTVEKVTATNTRRGKTKLIIYEHARTVIAPHSGHGHLALALDALLKKLAAWGAFADH